MSKDLEQLFGGEETSRTAAHEAGHVLVAWLSAAIRRVPGIVVHLEGGRSRVEVLREVRTPYHPVMLWDMLVISAAGMAAEALTHTTFHTSNARVDLEGMRLVVDTIRTACGTLRAPWPKPSGASAPPFEKYFASGLTDDEAELMRSAYLRARDLVIANRGAYERLRTAMIVKIELVEAEIETALRMKKA